MGNKNILETMAQYRLKVEKDGKVVANVPSLFALPGMLMMPKLSLTGLVAAPLLGMKVRLENEDGKDVDVEGAVRNVVETVRDTAEKAAKTIREEIDRAWESVNADDPESAGEEETAGEKEPAEEAEAGEKAEQAEAPEESGKIREIVEDLEKHEAEEDVPTIQVNPDDSEQA